MGIFFFGGGGELLEEEREGGEEGGSIGNWVGIVQGQLSGNQHTGRTLIQANKSLYNLRVVVEQEVKGMIGWLGTW